MSIIQWSTPERRAGDRDLPTVPNEIYLNIFEHIAPTSMRLLFPEQLKTLSNLSRVCKFFCNVCLPRIFEDLDFSAYPTRVSSRAWTLCEHIAAQQPLALSLAQCVKVCRFEKLVSEDPPVSHTLYISGLAHMKNICELTFLQSSMSNAHWDVIANLESLEKLGFTFCYFEDGSADADHGKRLKVKVPCLRMTRCNGVAHLTPVIDAPHLRTLTMDFQSVVDQADWLSKTSMTELCLKDTHAVPVINGDEQVKRILGKMPQSIQVLTLPVYTPDTDLFGDPMWKNMPLRSLTVTAMERCPGMTAVRMICKSIRVHTGLQSFTLTDNINTLVTTAEVRHTVQKQLSNLPELNFVNIYGVAVRLVDGKWIDVTK